MRYICLFFLFLTSLSAENRYTDEKRIDQINEKIDNLKNTLNNISDRMQKNNEQLKVLNEEIAAIEINLEKFINGLTYGYEFYRQGNPVNP